MMDLKSDLERIQEFEELEKIAKKYDLEVRCYPMRLYLLRGEKLYLNASKLSR